MTLPRYTNWAVDSAGTAQPGVKVIVNKKSDGTPATIYYNETGTLTKSNPWNTDAFGKFEFYAEDGEYRITIGTHPDTVTYDINIDPEYFADLSDLQADTVAVRTTGKLLEVQKYGYVYEVADAAATDHNVTTAGGVKLYVLPKDGEVWDEQWFDISNDADRVNAALRYAGEKAINTGKVYKVRVKGTYTMDKPIQMFYWQTSSSRNRFVSLHLDGSGVGYVNNQRTQFKFTDTNSPGIVVDKVRNCTIRGISIIGSANNLLLPSYTSLRDRDGWWNTGGAEEGNIWANHNGVIFDIFDNSLAVTEQYDSLNGTENDINYYATTEEGGTTGFIMEDCEIQGWIDAINTAGSGVQLGDSIVFRDVNISYNRRGVVSGESQNRGIHLENCHGKGLDIINACGSGYGSATGNPVFLNKGVFVFIRAIVDVTASRGTGSADNVYFESTITVGHIDGGRYRFNDCIIKLTDFSGFGSWNPDTRLDGGGRVVFEGGYLGCYNNKPHRLHIPAPCRFNSVDMDAPPVPSRYPTDIELDNVSCRYMNYLPFQRNVESEQLLSGIIGNNGRLTEGGIYSETLRGTKWRISGDWINIWKGSVTATLTGTEGEINLSVTADYADSFTVGEIVGCSYGASWTTISNDVNGNLNAPYNIPIGEVSAINGTDITLIGAPKGLYDYLVVNTSDTFYAGIQFPSVFKNPSYADFTSGSNVLTNVTNASQWLVGEPIRTDENNLIQSGTIVTAVGANTLTLSRNVNGTRTGYYVYHGRGTIIEFEWTGGVTNPPNHIAPKGSSAYSSYSSVTAPDQGSSVVGWVAHTDGQSGHDGWIAQFAGPGTKNGWAKSFETQAALLANTETWYDIGDFVRVTSGGATYVVVGSGGDIVTAGGVNLDLVGSTGIPVVDGVTAPSAITGLAQIYVDTADGDLKIIFGDGTIKTIATDT